MSYVQLTREEFENWLDDIGFRGRWKIKPGRGGMYQLELSPMVAIEINSTTGSRDEVMGLGQASMNLRLVSRVHGKTLNKKAMGQSHFARTTNWRTNWAKGVERMKAAYEASKGWYDQIAKIDDREAYQTTTLARIEAHPGWETDPFLSSLHERVKKGGVLTEKQEVALDRKDSKPSRPEVPAAPVVEGPDLEMMRELFRRARAAQDSWTVQFVGDVGQKVKAGVPLTPRQREVLDSKFEQYNIGGRGRRAALDWSAWQTLGA